MVKRLFLIAWIFFGLLPMAGLAQQPPKPAAGGAMPSDELKDKASRALGAIDEAQKALDERADQMNAQCLRAFGHIPFCSCLAKKTPIAIDFTRYVAITSAGKDATAYPRLDATDKEIIAATLAARDSCLQTVKERE